MPKNKRFIYLFVFLVFNLALFVFGLIYNRKINVATSPLFYSPPSTPVIKNKLPPVLGTSNYLLLDPATNTVLLGSNIHQRIFPASTTKLATALTALNLFPLDEVISAVPYTEGKVMELQLDEKVTVKTLVSALLVYSANDAAFNLAHHYQGGEIAFVEEMNKLVQKYNLVDTHFVNYDGIHHPDHYSTVYDLGQLARMAQKLPIIADVVKNPFIDVSDLTGERKYHLVSTNELLGKVFEIEGLKTGWTPEAGGCFIALARINGHQIITVVAQSLDRFADTTALINWAKSNLSWEYRSY